VLNFVTFDKDQVTFYIFKEVNVAKPQIQPLSDRILIKPMPKEEKTASGIVLPDTLSKDRPEMGEVLAVGPGKPGDDNDLIPVAVKVGQKVYFTKYGPTEIKVDGVEYLIVDEKDVLAVIS